MRKLSRTILFFFPLVISPLFLAATTTFNVSNAMDFETAFSTAVDGDVIEFDQGIVFTLTAFPYVFNADITINGNGGTIDFGIPNNFAVNANVIMNDLSIVNGPIGGIFVNPTGILTMNNCTLSGIAGGVIINSGSLVINNSTFSGNELTTPSFFINGTVITNSGTTSINNSTFSGNTVGSGGGTIASSNNNLTISNSIVSNTIGGPDIYLTGTGSIIHNNNIVTSCAGSSCPTFFKSNDPLLGPLQNNGGKVPTMAIGNGSPAINMGDQGSCLSLDQRGYGRNGVCDIGAYEYRGIAPQLIPTLSQWGLISLGLFMLIFGIVAVRRQALS